VTRLDLMGVRSYVPSSELYPSILSLFHGKVHFFAGVSGESPEIDGFRPRLGEF